MSVQAFVEHVALTVTDINWYIDFFTQECGMTITRRKEEAGKLVQVWLKGGIQLIAAKKGAALANPHHIGLVVSDFAAARQAMLKYAEIEPLAGKPEKWLQLPDGIVLELFQAKPNALESILAVDLK